MERLKEIIKEEIKKSHISGMGSDPSKRGPYYSSKKYKDMLPDRKNISTPKKTIEFISHTAVVLDGRSKERLVNRFKKIIPSNWEILADSMVVKLGPLEKEKQDVVGLPIKLLGISYAFNDRVISLAVDCDKKIKPDDRIPQIIIAYNKNFDIDLKRPVNIPESEYRGFKVPIILRGYIEQIPLFTKND